MSPTNVHAGAKWNVNSKTWLSPVRSSVDCHEVAASHPDRVLDRLHAGISTLVSPFFYFILSFFLSHSPVHLDRVSSASFSTPWGPISAHVHFAQQIISNVVRRGVKRERVKNKEERVAVSWNRTTYRKPRVGQVFSWIPGLVFMRYSSFFFTFDRPDYRFQKFAKCGCSFFSHSPLPLLVGAADLSWQVHKIFSYESMWNNHHIARKIIYSLIKEYKEIRI